VQLQQTSMKLPQLSTFNSGCSQLARSSSYRLFTTIFKWLWRSQKSCLVVYCCNKVVYYASYNNRFGVFA